jgi:thioredoxin-dependent peroxiredoxin
MSNFKVSHSGKQGFLPGKTAFLALGIVALALGGPTGPAFAAPADEKQVAGDTSGPKDGQVAPDFALPAENGKDVKLSDFRGKTVVVFFYDKDDSPVSRKEHKMIQKDYSKYKLKGADILGIGPDPVASHKAMHTELDLNYHLLTDKNDEVRKLYHLQAQKGRYGVVVDKNGIVRKVAGGIGGLSEADIFNIYDYVSGMPGAGT